MTLQIILIFVALKLIIVCVIGPLLWKIMGPELRAPKHQHGMPGVPCAYCRATPSLFHSEEQRWDGDDLVLVRTYECRECHMPFWRVERVPTHADEKSIR